MAITPTLTVFERSAMPSNLLIVPEWQRFAQAWLGDPAKWRQAVRRYAEQKGGALVMLADDTLVTFTKRDDGRISRRTYKPGRWAWTTDRAARQHG